MTTLLDRAEWLADKLHNGGDYGKEAASLLVKQAAEIERLQADAARYQWLRGRVPGGTYRVMGIIYSEGGAGVDAGIDAAIADRAALARMDDRALRLRESQAHRRGGDGWREEQDRDPQRHTRPVPGFADFHSAEGPPTMTTPNKGGGPPTKQAAKTLAQRVKDSEDRKRAAGLKQVRSLWAYPEDFAAIRAFAAKLVLDSNSSAMQNPAP